MTTIVHVVLVEFVQRARSEQDVILSLSWVQGLATEPWPVGSFTCFNDVGGASALLTRCRSDTLPFSDAKRTLAVNRKE